jgi:hypothetical protein
MANGIEIKEVQNLQTKLSSLMDELDHKVFRPSQKQVFQCSIKCTEARATTQAEFHDCLSQCSAPLQRHEAAVMSELQEFQHRVQRCVQQCQDKQATTQNQSQFERCVSDCAVFYQKELGAMRPKLLKMSWP